MAEITPETNPLIDEPAATGENPLIDEPATTGENPEVAPTDTQASSVAPTDTQASSVTPPGRKAFKHPLDVVGDFVGHSVIGGGINFLNSLGDTINQLNPIESTTGSIPKVPTPEVIKPQSTGEVLSSSLVDLALTYGTGAGEVALALRGAKAIGIAGKVEKVAEGTKGLALKQAVGDLTAGNVHDERLSNMLAKWPVLGPVFDLVKQNPDDAFLKARLKLAVENAGLLTGSAKIADSLYIVGMKLAGKSPQVIAKAEAELLAGTEVQAVGQGISSIPATPKVLAGLFGKNGLVLTGADDVSYKAAETSLKAGLVPVPPKAVVPGAPLLPPVPVTHQEFLGPLEDMGRLSNNALGAKLGTIKGLNGPTHTSIDKLQYSSRVLDFNDKVMFSNLRQLGKTEEQIVHIAEGARQYTTTEGAKLFAAARASAHGELPAIDAFKTLFKDFSDFQSKFKQVSSGSKAVSIEGKSLTSDSTAFALKDSKRVEELAELVRLTEGHPDQLTRVLNQNVLSLGEKITKTAVEYRLSGMLSQPKTIIQNMTGVGNALWDTSLGLFPASPRGAATSWRELMGMRQNLRDSWTMAGKAFTQERGILSPRNSTELQGKAISTELWNVNPESFGGRALDVFGMISRFGSRLNMATDQFATDLAYRGIVSGRASGEAQALGLKGAAVDEHIRKALQGALDEGVATSAGDLATAQGRTWTTDYTRTPTWLGKGALGEDGASGGLTAMVFDGIPSLKGPLGKLTVTPFVNTPVNVMRAGVDYLPALGALTRENIQALSQGGVEMNRVIAKQTFGSLVGVTATGMAIEGHITGGEGPPGTVYPPGHQFYAFRIPTEDGGVTYMSYQNLPIIGNLLALHADFAQLTGLVDEETRQELADNLVMGTIAALGEGLDQIMDDDPTLGAANPQSNLTSLAARQGKFVYNQLAFRGMVDLFHNLDNFDAANMSRFATNYATSFIPGYEKTLVDLTDPVQREVRSNFDRVKAKTVGASTLLAAKTNHFGEEVDTKPGALWSVFTPARVTKTIGDATMDEMSRISGSGYKPEGPRGTYTRPGLETVHLKDIRNEDGLTAFDRQQQFLAGPEAVRFGGKTFREATEAVMNSSRYNKNAGAAVAAQLDGVVGLPGPRMIELRSVETRYRNLAIQKLVDSGEYPALGRTSFIKNKIQDKQTRTSTRFGRGIPQNIKEIRDFGK